MFWDLQTQVLTMQVASLWQKPWNVLVLLDLVAALSLVGRRITSYMF